MKNLKRVSFPYSYKNGFVRWCNVTENEIIIDHRIKGKIVEHKLSINAQVLLNTRLDDKLNLTKSRIKERHGI